MTCHSRFYLQQHFYRGRHHFNQKIAQACWTPAHLTTPPFPFHTLAQADIGVFAPSCFLSFSLRISYRCYNHCGKLQQWWFRVFSACEAENVHAGGCVTNVAVCWASHGLIVRHRGCAYTQSLMRGTLCVGGWCSCRGITPALRTWWSPDTLWTENMSLFKQENNSN